MKTYMKIRILRNRIDRAERLLDKNLEELNSRGEKQGKEFESQNKKARTDSAN